MVVNFVNPLSELMNFCCSGSLFNTSEPLKMFFLVYVNKKTKTKII